MPIKARIGVKEDGFKSFIKKLSPLIPLSESIHAVIVVPTLAPIITFIACFKFIIPELTKPTTITVVAEELCITDVTPQPVRKPANLLVVILQRTELNLLPARLSSA